MDKIMMVVIEDTESKDILGVYHLVNPDMDKLNWLNTRLNRRFTDEEDGIENPFSDSFYNVEKYIQENFVIHNNVTSCMLRW